MLTASGSKSIREAQEVLLIDSVEHLDNGALDDLVFQGCNSERPKPPIRLRDVRPSGGSCPVAPTTQSGMQRSEVVLQLLPVLLPSDSICPRGGFPLDGEVRLPKSFQRHMVWKSGKLRPLVLAGDLTHPFQRTRSPVRLWVRGVSCWLGFLLACPLPSTASAAGRPTFFGGFSGTIGQSDLPGAFIMGGHRKYPSAKRTNLTIQRSICRTTGRGRLGSIARYILRGRSLQE